MAKRTCSIDGCARTHYARGWCQKHYMRWWQHDDPTHTAKPGPKPTHGCKMEGCKQPHQARGWCRKHYQRWQRTGHPEGDTPERRFKRHTKVTADGCWEWTASRFEDGYGQFSVDGRTVHAHRDGPTSTTLGRFLTDLNSITSAVTERVSILTIWKLSHTERTSCGGRPPSQRT